MEKHIKILGGLYIGMGALMLVPALLISLIMTGAGVLSGDLTAFLITSTIGSAISFLLLIFGLPCMIGGVYFIKRRKWAKSMLIVLGVINLLNFPLGTALGFYTLWVLVSEDTRPMYAEFV